MDDLNYPTLSADHPLNQAPSGLFKRKATKFEAKLTPEERCQVLALVLAGIQRNIVAEAFQIDRRTVGHICNPASPHYKPTRRSCAEVGRNEFIAAYATKDAMDRVQKVYADADALERANKSKVQYKQDHKADAPSPRAKGKAGIQVVQPEQCAYTHRLEIEFKEDLDPPGWYYRDLDSQDHETWLHNGPESLKTSQSCLSAAVVNLMDD